MVRKMLALALLASGFAMSLGLNCLPNIGVPWDLGDFNPFG